jgi:outer membrane protein assembly factor BamD (BamD/ComL family)
MFVLPTARLAGRLLMIVALAAGSRAASAAPPSTCSMPDDYSQALCSYQHRNFAEAQTRFAKLSARDLQEPETVRAIYFLARTHMKLGRFDEASQELIRIYSVAPAFYREWNCDFLLGECRRAQGKG